MSLVLLFNLLILSGLILIVLSPGRPGVLDIGFFGLTVYCIPLMTGTAYYPGSRHAVELLPMTYAVMMAPLIALLLALAARLANQGAQSAPDRHLPRLQFDHHLPLYIALAGLSLVFTVDFIREGMPLITGHAKKTDIALMSLFLINFPISFCMAWATLAHKHSISLCIFVLAAFIAVTFQSRSPVVFSVITFALISIRTTRLSGGVVKAICGIGAIAALILISAFKMIKGRLLQGQFDKIQSPLAAEFWEKLFKGMEPNGTVTLLNIVVRDDFTLQPLHLVAQLTKIIPFSESLLGIPTSKFGVLVVQDHLHFYKFGWANNVWAEIFAVCGIGGVLVFSLTWVASLAGLQHMMNRGSPAIKCIAAALVPQLAFLITRVSLGSSLSYIANGLLFSGLTILCGKLIYDALRLVARHPDNARPAYIMSN